ncbi:hypothetical protein C8F01DRAFT_1138324 [Mycena amicta]|nr:hypothetical protein C8F01DRAFT_1138324 [Mycena amicta]
MPRWKPPVVDARAIDPHISLPVIIPPPLSLEELEPDQVNFVNSYGLDISTSLDEVGIVRDHLIARLSQKVITQLATHHVFLALQISIHSRIPLWSPYNRTYGLLHLMNNQVLPELVSALQEFIFLSDALIWVELQLLAGDRKQKVSLDEALQLRFSRIHPTLVDVTRYIEELYAWAVRVLTTPHWLDDDPPVQDDASDSGDFDFDAGVPPPPDAPADGDDAHSETSVETSAWQMEAADSTAGSISTAPTTPWMSECELEFSSEAESQRLVSRSEESN